MFGLDAKMSRGVLAGFVFRGGGVTKTNVTKQNVVSVELKIRRRLSWDKMGNEKKNAPRPQHDWVKCNAAPLLMSNGLVASINRHHRIAIVDPPVQHKVESSVTSPSRGKNGSENIEFLGIFKKKCAFSALGHSWHPPSKFSGQKSISEKNQLVYPPRKQKSTVWH